MYATQQKDGEAKQEDESEFVAYRAYQSHSAMYCAQSSPPEGGPHALIPSYSSREVVIPDHAGMKRIKRTEMDVDDSNHAV